MKSFSYLIIAALILSSTSCDDLLDVDAKGTISGDVLTNQEAIESALNAAYYSLNGIYDGSDGGELLGGDFALISTLLSKRNTLEILWDDVNGAPYSDFIDKDIRATNLRVEANWRRAYEVLNVINSILAKVDVIEDSTAFKRIKGEALAIRGLLYFEMVRLWGPQYSTSTFLTPAIPIIVEPITEVNEIKTPVLATVGEVYVRAEQDLTMASSLLAEFGKNGVALSHYACEAYLMRLSLQKGDFEAAENHANAILNSGVFSLANSPIEAFNNATNSPEDIYAIQQSTSSTTGDRSTSSGLANYFSSLTESGLGVMRIQTASLRESSFLENEPAFSAIDLRGQIDTDVDVTTTSEQISTAFYTNILNTFTLSSSKFMRGDRVIPVIRLAEIHLGRAEAIFEQRISVIDPIGLADLNAVRTRAGLPELQNSDFPSTFAYYDSVMLERNRELLFEGQLLHDLKRLGGTVGGSPATDNKFILPIPQSERDTWN